MTGEIVMCQHAVNIDIDWIEERGCQSMAGVGGNEVILELNSAHARPKAIMK